MALDRLTQITSSGISSTSTITVSAVAGSITGVVTATSLSVTGSVTTGLDVSGIVTATTVQVGSATTIHTTGIDLGSGNITSHNINSTGIITSTSFVGPVTGNVTGDLTGDVTGNVTGDLTGDVTGNVSSSGANTLGSLTVTNDATVGGALTITGDLTVNGTTTTIDTAVTAVDSLAIDGNAIIDGSVGIGTDNPAEDVHIKKSRADVLIEGTNDTVSGNVANLSLMAPYYRKVGYSIKDSAGNEDFFIGRPYGQGDSNPDLVINMTGNEKVRIRNSGNIGIGTDNPQKKLVVSDGAQGVEISPAESGISRLLSYNRNTSAYTSLQIEGSDITFVRDGGTNAAKIDSSGRILIGNFNSNIGDSPLQVYTSDSKHPAIRTNASNANGYTLLADAYGSDESQVTLGISYSGSGFVIGRNVKVSDTADNEYLSTQDSYSTRQSALKLNNDGDLIYLCAPSSTTVATDSAVTLNERFRITSAGYVGIGTNVPTTQLDVRENDTRGAIRIGGDNSTGHRIFIQANGYNGSYIDSYGGDQYRKLKIAASPMALTGGDITLGEFDVTDTRNSGGLHIKQSAGVSFTANSGQSVSRNWRVRNDDHGWGNLDFSVGSSNTTWGDTGADAVLSLTSSKNVGINSTSPTHKLDIVGGVSQQLQITGTEADLWLKSTGPGGTYRILGSTGTNTHRFRIYDETNSLDRLNILSDGKIFFGNNTQTALGSASKDYCDIDAHCSGPMSIGSNGPSSHNTVLKLVGRKVVNWYWYGYVNTGNTYAHLRTSLWGGGSPHGQIDYIMGGFRIEGYQYTTAATSVEYIMFHNWSGSLAGYSRYHHGNYDPGNTVYVDSTGYVTIRLVNATYKGFSIDLIQQPWYPVRDIRVTSIINSNSTSV